MTGSATRPAVPARRGPRAAGTAPFRIFSTCVTRATFCIITAALISGAIVERMRFSAYVVFITLWAIVVYSPIAHWVWGGGWLADMGALDFAGGTVVHVNAGVAALVAASSSASAATIHRRRSCRTTCRSRCSAQACCGLDGSGSTPAARSPPRPSPPSRSRPRSSRPMGDAGRLDAPRHRAHRQADGRRRRHRHRRGPGGDHPGCGIHRADERDCPGGDCRGPQLLRLCIWRAKTSLDDSLDVVAAHGVGGTVGALLTGVFAQKALNGVADGLLFGNPAQLGIQAVAVGCRDCLQRRRSASCS